MGDIIMPMIVMLLALAIVLVVCAILVTIRTMIAQRKWEEERKEIMFDKLPTLEDVIREEKKKRKRGKK